MFALLPLALIGGAVAYVRRGRTMSTDDAYVNTRQVGISTDVAGIVSDVDVTDNQHVAVGQFLYRLDSRQFRIAVDNAKANLAQVALNLESMKKNYSQMVSDAAAQQSQMELDQATFGRYSQLLSSNAIAKMVYDQARFTLQTDTSKLTALRQQALAQLALLNGNPNAPVAQLVPVRVRVDAGKGNMPILRAGMSVELNVDTGHARGLPKFVTNLLGTVL